MTDLPDDDPIALSLPGTLQEELALIDGQLAMMDLLAAPVPGPARFAAFHKLRCAARHDPIAAFYGVPPSSPYDETAPAFVHKSPTHGLDQADRRQAAWPRPHAGLR